MAARRRPALALEQPAPNPALFNTFPMLNCDLLGEWSPVYDIEPSGSWFVSEEGLKVTSIKAHAIHLPMLRPECAEALFVRALVNLADRARLTEKLSIKEMCTLSPEWVLTSVGGAQPWGEKTRVSTTNHLPPGTSLVWHDDPEFNGILAYKEGLYGMCVFRTPRLIYGYRSQWQHLLEAE
jgi:hypothetical protein